MGPIMIEDAVGLGYRRLVFRVVLIGSIGLLACCGKSASSPDAAGPMSCAEVYLLGRDHGDELKSCAVADDCVMLGEIRTSCECAPDSQIVLNVETVRSNPRYVEGIERCNGGGSSCDSYQQFDPLDCVAGKCVLPTTGYVACNEPPTSRTVRLHHLQEPDYPYISNRLVTLDYGLFPDEVSVSPVYSYDFTAGDVVTLHWVFYTDPSACLNPVPGLGSKCGLPDLMIPEVDGSLGYAGPAPSGGAIVGSNTTVFFPSLSKSVNADGADDPDFVIGKGLLNLGSSEIHILLRTHGPKLDGVLGDAQLSSVNGGCLTGEPNEGLCEDLQIAVFAPWLGYN